MNLLNDIRLICKGPSGDGSGCRLQGAPIKYSALVNEHAAECAKGNVECSLGCGAAVDNINAYEVHLTYECPKALVECKTCSSKIVRNEIQQHSCEEILLS